MAPGVDVLEPADEVWAGVDAAGLLAADAGLDDPVAPPEELEAAAGLLALLEPDALLAGELAEDGLLAEPETPLAW